MIKSFKQLLKDKVFVNNLLGILIIISFVIAIKGSFETYSIIIVTTISLVNIISYGKIKIEIIRKILFYFWTIHIAYFIAGKILGILGIIIVMIIIMLRIVIRALNSKYYKDSINNIIKTIKEKK